MTNDELLPMEYTLRQYRAKDRNIRVFYKYQAFRSYTVNTLANQMLFLSKYEQLNDPFDLVLTHLGRNSGDGSLLEKFSNVGIFSVSEHPISQLMWAHYADSYRGMCIGYAAYVVPNPRVLHPVRYIKSVPKKIFKPESLSQQELLEWYLLSKSRAWSYEREWRFLMGGTVGLVQNVVFPIVEIILGPRMPLDQRVAVIEATRATEPSIRVAQPTILNGQIGITLEQWIPP